MNLQFSGEMWFWKGPAPWHFITEWKTSLFPKDGRYIVPVKTSVRRAERLELGDVLMIRLAVDV